MTQDEFGASIGLKANSVSSIENNVNKITEQNIKAICREFDINEEWLRTGNGSKKKERDTDYEKIIALIGEKDPKAKQAIKDYWNLSPEDKELFWKFIDKFMKGEG